jgi:Ca2+-binding EF-hand superfamily protein
MRRIPFGLLVGVLALGASPALGEEAATIHDPRAAFAETDLNHDGRVDREEFHHRIVEIFFHGDRDKDGYMTPAELAANVAFPDDFKGADRDADGRISLYEFVQVRFATFGEVDTDADGLLSVAEVVAAFEGKS